MVETLICGKEFFILAEKYNGDSAFASKCVAVSTALSLITTPLWCLVA